MKAYPLLIAAFFVLAFYVNEEMTTIPFDCCLPILIGTVCSAAIVSCLSSALLKDVHKGAQISLITLIAFYSLLVLEPFERWSEYLPEAICILWSVLLVAAFWTMRTRRDLAPVSKRLDKMGIILLLAQLVLIAHHEYHSNLLFDQVKLKDIALDERLLAPSKRPDIYYIILDGCASDRTFKNLMGYDSSPFTRFLKEKGFVVPQNSHSNYGMTELSLPSFLNMSYLDSLPSLLGATTVDYGVNNRLIRESRIFRIVKKCGYKLINIGSGFGPTCFNPYANENKEGTWLNEFSLMILQRSLVAVFDFNCLLDELRQIRLSEFENVEKASRESGPKFVFMHVLLPHPPYIFDAAGNPVESSGIDVDWSAPETKRAKPYVDQARFAQSKVRHLVETLLADPANQPVIIIHSDHGSASTGSLCNSNPTVTYLRERMGILNAYYLPGQNKDAVYDTITPVNTLRVVLDLYFHAHYPLLEDRSYFSNYIVPLQYRDVTSILKGH